METNENVKLVEDSDKKIAISNGQSEDDKEKLTIQDASSDVSSKVSDDDLDDNTTNGKTTDKSTKKRPKPPIIFRCEICQKEFENDNKLKEHLDTHDFIYFCETCKAKFKLTMNFIDHVREHRADKVYKCALCEFTDKKRSKMTLHLRTKHDQFKKYRCKVCKKGTNVYTHFLEHEYIHSEQKPYECDKCESAFPQKTALNAHNIRMHTYDPVSCDICKKECRNKMELRSHKTAHKKQAAICKECGKVLSSNDKLRIHMRIHTGERPYPCRHCNKAFKTSTFRSDHERIHTGEKPHICPICGKGFSQRTSMKIHETIHSTEKPFQCEICGKSYKAKPNLNSHVKKCRLKSTNEVNENINCIQQDDGSIIELQSNFAGQMYVPNNYNPYNHDQSANYHGDQNGTSQMVNLQPIQQMQYQEQVLNFQQHQNVVYGGSPYHVQMGYGVQFILPEEVDLEQAQQVYHQ